MKFIKNEVSFKRHLTNTLNNIKKFKFVEFVTFFSSVTIQSHLDDLITFDPSNDLITTEEHQQNPFDILLEGGRMDSEGEAYLLYEEMSPGELDSYYFRSD